MATFSLKRFTKPGILRRIDEPLLLQFLNPHRDFFIGRGVALPALDDESGEIDYDGLASVFMTPDTDTPRELVDALFLVDEMATEEGMDDLLEAAQQAGISLDGSLDATPADVALHAWFQAPELLEQRHSEQYLTNARSFEYYQTTSESKVLTKPPSKKVLKNLQDDLDGWFEEKRRGRGTRVHPDSKGGEFWFRVCHGDPYRREPCLERGKPGAVHYRPEKDDLVVYNPALGELRVNARSKGEKDLYRRMFGFHLFGDAEFFPGTGKYTLDPLRTDGPGSLVCGDVPGLKKVVLREVHFLRGGPENEIEIRRAADLFAAYEARGRTLPTKPRIIRAKFQVKFEVSRAPRMVTIKPSNIAIYKRDSDGEIVDQWLSRRGFVRLNHQADAAA